MNLEYMKVSFFLNKLQKKHDIPIFLDVPVYFEPHVESYRSNHTSLWCYLRCC